MAALIVLIIFGSIASLFIVPRYFKSVERQKMAETLRVAIEKGQALPPEVIDAMSSDVRPAGLPPSPQRDLRTGIIWLGVGLGFVAPGLIAVPGGACPCRALRRPVWRACTT